MLERDYLNSVFVRYNKLLNLFMSPTAPPQQMLQKNWIQISPDEIMFSLWTHYVKPVHQNIYYLLTIITIVSIKVLYLL